MIIGAVFESLFSSMNSGDSQKQNGIDALMQQQQNRNLATQQAAALAQAEQLLQERRFEQQKKMLLPSFKQLEGAAPSGYKDSSGVSMAYKSPDNPLETLSANARQPFDSANSVATDDTGVPAPATVFFGDSMPQIDLQRLVNPDSDPRIVDLHEAVNFVAQNLKSAEALRAAKAAAPDREQGQTPKPTVEQCARLETKLHGFVTQRAKFQKTIVLAQDQWMTWHDANSNALINQAKDGLEYFVGNYLEVLSKRGLAAERYRRILEKNAASMTRDGIDVAALMAKIDRLQATSAVGQVAGAAIEGNTWQTFVKDGASSLVTQLSSSNDEIKDMLQDPRLQRYLNTEAPELNTLLDISKIAAESKVFGKWVARKMPVVALAEISTKTIYNGTDWLLSLNRIMESNKINGQILSSAQSLQRHIDETAGLLQPCH